MTAILSRMSSPCNGGRRTIAGRQSTVDAGKFEERAVEAGLERLVGVNGDNYQQAFAGFTVDVVAALDALELPAVFPRSRVKPPAGGRAAACRSGYPCSELSQFFLR